MPAFAHIHVFTFTYDFSVLFDVQLAITLYHALGACTFILRQDQASSNADEPVDGIRHKRAVFEFNCEDRDVTRLREIYNVSKCDGFGRVT